MRAGGTAAAAQFIGCLGEGKVFFNSLDVCIGYEARLTQRAFPLAALLLKNVTLALFPAQHFPCARHLESLGNGFTSFCFT